jgi:4-hydroxybenzoate polyprenyltransferase
LFIGFCAVSLVWANALMLGENPLYAPNTLFVFFSTVFTYSILKFRRGEDIELTTHQQWASAHPQLHRNIMLIALIGTAVFFLQLNFEQKLYAVALAAFTALYALVELPIGKKKIKLRDIGLLKTLFVAVVWSVTTVVIPINEVDLQDYTLLFLLLRRFLFVLALTICFEIKDLEADNNAAIKTLPVYIGVPGTKLLAQLVLLLLMAVNFIQYAVFHTPLYDMASVNLSLLVSIIAIQPIHEDTSPLWYYVVLDGMMVFQFLLVCAAHYLFAV